MSGAITAGPVIVDKVQVHASGAVERPSLAARDDKVRVTSSYDALARIALIDQLILIASGVGLYLAREDAFEVPLSIWITIAIGSVVFSLTAYARNLYSYMRMQGIVRQLMPFTLVIFQTAVCVAATLYFLRPTEPPLRHWLLYWAVTNVLSMGLVRLFFWHWISRPAQAALFTRKILLVGASEKAERMIQHFAQHRNQYTVKGIFLTGNEEAAWRERVPATLAMLTSINELAAYCEKEAIDDIIVTPELENNSESMAILKALETLPCNVKYCIPGNMLSRPLADLELISHLPVVTIFRMPLKGASLALKRLEDIVLSSIALLIASPVMLLAALLIALEGGGPILFRQKRHGFGGAEFDIFKFRSMRASATTEEGVPQATRNDVRVTWVGRILRRTSIDELPQLFNVFKGDMSLVGPRPHAITHNYYYRELIDGYVARQRMKPGITGWAQVNGWRGETDTLEKMRKRVEHDLYYVENWSLWFDIKIMVLTAFTFMLHKNAY